MECDVSDIQPCHAGYAALRCGNVFYPDTVERAGYRCSQKLSDHSYLLSRDHSIYHNGYNAAELRRLFVKRDLPEWLDRTEVSRLLLQILDLAEDGLSRRGLQEEHFLTPLYLRAERLESPAREIADSQAPLDEFVDRFGRISDV